MPKRCARRGCDTILSRYNDAKLCWLHSDPKPTSHRNEAMPAMLVEPISREDRKAYRTGKWLR